MYIPWRPSERDLKAPVFGLRLLLIPDCVKYHLITGRSGILIRWKDSGGQPCHGQQALHLVLTSSQIFSSLTSWLLSRYYQLHQHSYLFKNISRVIVTIYYRIYNCIILVYGLDTRGKFKIKSNAWFGWPCWGCSSGGTHNLPRQSL